MAALPTAKTGAAIRKQVPVGQQPGTPDAGEQTGK